MENGTTCAIIGNWGVHEMPEGYGLTVCRYNEQEGTLEQVGAYTPNIRAGKVIVDAERGVIYCTDEIKMLPGSGGKIPGGHVYV